MDNENIEKYNSRDPEMSLRYTKLVGVYRHVTRLNYPCGDFDDIKGPHGKPPTVNELINGLRSHKDICEECD